MSSYNSNMIPKEIIPVEELQNIIGGNIRKQCIEKKINMMELAEKVGMSYEYLRHIVAPNGKKQLSLYSVYKFSILLDTTIDELIKK